MITNVAARVNDIYTSYSRLYNANKNVYLSIFPMYHVVFYECHMRISVYVYYEKNY